MKILNLNNVYREEVNALIKDKWHGPISVSRGRKIDTSMLPGFVVVENNDLVGVITYEIINNECEIVTLNSLIENKGVGTMLLNAVYQKATIEKLKRVWLITTNDNTHAIRYYQKRGFSLVDIYINAMDESRRIKPSIPLTGTDGIPLKHEIEFEILLG